MIEKTLDLHTLGLPAGTHRVTVKARASEYKDSFPSNEVSYQAEETYTISGTWYFNETLTLPNTKILQYVNFTFSNDYSDRGFLIKPNEVILRDSSTNNATMYTKGGGWSSYKGKPFREVTFDGVQVVSKEFYEWLLENAVVTSSDHIYTVHGNYIINETPSIVWVQPLSTIVTFWTMGGAYKYNELEIANNIIFYRISNGDGVKVYTIGEGWKFKALRYITFVKRQTVSKEFYEWLSENSVRE